MTIDKLPVTDAMIKAARDFVADKLGWHRDALQMRHGRTMLVADAVSMVAEAMQSASDPRIADGDDDLLARLHARRGLGEGPLCMKAKRRIEGLSEALTDAKCRLIAEGYLPDGEVCKRYTALAAKDDGERDG